MQVLIIYGSKSDSEVMSGALKVLKEFDIKYTCHILSAHRLPEQLTKTISEAEKNGCQIIIAGAGLAAHLPGVIASQTILPVIGVPISSALNGLDSLLSIVQMPKPIPVATVGINNSYNAGMLAIEILAIKDQKIKQKLQQYRQDMKTNFLKDNANEVKI